MSIEEAVEIARTLLLLMYGKKGRGCKTLDELRYKLSSQTDLSANMLPPTEDSFHHHVLHCLYQTKHSLIQMAMVGTSYQMELLILNFLKKKQLQRHFEMLPTCTVLMTSVPMPSIVNVC